MNFRLRPIPEISINLTPLIDIVFLLLIFFMVSTSFEDHGELNIQLPEAQAAKSQNQEMLIEVAIDADGQFIINDKTLHFLDKEQLRGEIVKVSDNNNELPLIIHADANTPHKWVVMVMEIAKGLGFEKLSIRTNKIL